MRWSGTVPAGSKTAHQAAFWDVQATVCEIAGVRPPKTTDGISFLPTLLGKPQPQHEFLYWESSEKSHMGIDKGYKQAVRKGDWKCLRFFLPERAELYNLKDDPEELNNLAATHPEVVKELLGKMDAAHVRNERFLLPFEKEPK
jgi:arylsulfatase A-like enzyme